MIHPHELNNFLEDTRHFFGYVDQNAFDKNGVYSEKLRQPVDPVEEWKKFFGCDPEENDVISISIDNLECNRFALSSSRIEFKMDNHAINIDSNNDLNKIRII